MRVDEEFLIALNGKIKETIYVDPFAQFLKILLDFETQKSSTTVLHCFASLRICTNVLNASICTLQYSLEPVGLVCDYALYFSLRY